MTATGDALSTPRDDYPDDCLAPPPSEGLQPLRPDLRPSPTPEPILPPGQVSSPPKSGRRGSNWRKSQPSQGDALLLRMLDGGRRPEMAAVLGREALASDPDEAHDESGSSESATDSSETSSMAGDRTSAGDQHAGGVQQRQRALGSMAMDGVAQSLPDNGVFDTLKSLAAGALAFASTEDHADSEDGEDDDDDEDADGLENPGEQSLISAPTERTLAARRDARLPGRNPVLGAAGAGAGSPFTSPRVSSPGDQSSGLARLGLDSPPLNLWPARVAEMNRKQDLPPINSPTSDGEGPTIPLPSIRRQLGDIEELSNEIARDAEIARRRRGPYIGLADMAPASIGKYSTAPGHVGSPPGSPTNGGEVIKRINSPSPDRLFPGEPTRFWQPLVHKYHGYASNTIETPSTVQSAAATSLGDGAANAAAIGLYVCRYQGCTAMPFQTQYLLNSHANVHSLSRPHYCPVKGCPRSEGGRGFKRKNEMIRHGLVHDSPGYVCPFCPDREHKYPRPDNLQRHVRVHHVNKDKDDPLLRDVLAQRPDGPSRGRRRRGVPV